MILREYIIPNYIRRVKLSDSRRPIYYNKGKSLPPYVQKKWDKKEYIYKWFKTTKGKVQYLVNKATGERVVANPRAAGTARYQVINGQQFYKASIHNATRRLIIEGIKDNFRPHLKDMTPVEMEHFPVHIEVELHDHIIDSEIRDQLWDMDNRFYPYQKAFQDLLTEEGIIPEDNIMYITKPPCPVFVPIDDGETRKLIFKIVRDDRQEIRANQAYRDYFKRSS